MNKRGFTLVEVLVSIALLAIIGVALGISLNKSFKSSSETNYNEFIEKVKSSAMLYVNNTSEVINDLNEDSYKIIKVKDLIDNGYVEDNMKNPNTGDKINPEDKVKVSYNSDKELYIDYPYSSNQTEHYLYTINYKTTYKNSENDICYKGLNTPILQLINDNGAKVHDLVKDKSIKAYMEDGTECTDNKINTSKIGTYKVRYDYTIDASNISTSDDVKSADRTIIINPSKPTINTFKIALADSNNVYKAKMDLEVSDVSDLKLKYCIVGYSSSASNNVNANDLINKCSDTPRVVNGVTQLNNVWKELNYSTSNGRFIDNKNFDISTEMSDFKDNNEAIFYVIVRNSFEEYNNKRNDYNNGVYILTGQIIFNLNNNNAYFNGVQKTGDNRYIIQNIKYNTPFSTVLNSYPNYQRVYLSKYVFNGWSTRANGSVEYNNNTSTPIRGNLNLYPVWQYDGTLPTCSLSVSGSNIVASFNDNLGSNNIIYYGWNSSYSGSTSSSKPFDYGTHTFYVKDIAMNEGKCSLNIPKPAKIIFNLNNGGAYFNGIQKTGDNRYIIENIQNNTPFNTVISSYPNYQRAYLSRHIFQGWSTSVNGGVSYNNSTTTPVSGDLNLYPVWTEDSSAPTCSLSISGGNIVASFSDNLGNGNIIYNGWNSSYSGSTSTSKPFAYGTHTYYVKDLALNEGRCSLDIPKYAKIIFNLNNSGAYFNGVQKTGDDKYIIENIQNNTPFSTILSSYPNYQRAYRPQYYFIGWSTSANGGVSYTNSTTTPVSGELNLYPVWESDTQAPTCNLSLNGSSISASVFENKSNNLAYYGWNSSYSGYNSTSTGISIGTTTYYTKDYSQNTSSCSINILNVTRTTTQNCHNVATKCASSRDCNPAGSCCRWDWNSGVKTVCEDGPTIVSCASGYTRYGEYCYKY